MSNAVEFYVVVDLEATCCTDRSIPHWQREIIEIGAVLVNRSFQVESEFQSFVRPVKNPVLTSFCSELTSITQEMVDIAPTYPDVIAQFDHWIDQCPDWVFCSWGDFDRKQIQREAKFHKIQNPIQTTCLNLKTLFSRSQNLPAPVGLSQALKTANLEFTGVQHRAIDDARNTAKLLPYSLGIQPRFRHWD